MKVSIANRSDYLAMALGRPSALKMRVEGKDAIGPVDAASNRTVLLLGATGFVGLHILRELLESDRIDRVHAVIRRGSAASLSARLDGVAKRFRLVLPNRHKLSLWEGDFTLPQLGLVDADWAALADDVDAVINAAGSTDHSFPYEYYRRTSVASYFRLVEFCYRGRPKSLHTIGSIGSEVFRRRSDFYRLGFYHCGYSRMKWVLKQVTLDLAARGVPTHLYLAPFVLGSRHTGFKDPGLLYSFWHMVSYALQLGCVWQGRGAFVPAVPADILARTVLRNLLAPAPATIVSPSLCVRNEDFAESLGLELTSWADFRGSLTRRYNAVPSSLDELTPVKLRRRARHYTFSRALFPADFPDLLDAISASADASEDEAGWGEYGPDFIARCAIANSIYRPQGGSRTHDLPLAGAIA